MAADDNSTPVPPGTTADAAIRRWMSARRSWIEPRRDRILLITLSGLGVVFLMAQLAGTEAQSIHSIPGAVDQPPNVGAGVDVAKWILLDYLLMLLVAVAVINALLLPRQRVGSKRQMITARLDGTTAEQRWMRVGVAATVLYLLADAVETSVLWWVANRLADGRTVAGGVFRLMSDAHNVKWLALAIALIAVAARWSRRTPRLPGTGAVAASPAPIDEDPDDAPPSEPVAIDDDSVRDGKGYDAIRRRQAVYEPTGADPASDWNAADHTPMQQISFEPEVKVKGIEFTAEATAADEDAASPIEGGAAAPGVGAGVDVTDAESAGPRTSADDWQPSNDRFGVAVSGGGIRSASFALGVFDVLRERGLLEKARYVTAVSGGSYAASALEHANRMGEDPRTRLLPRLRRRLNYLLPDIRTSFSGIVRVLLGLLLNLWILYLVIFMVARPVGWAIGSPLIQEGLRYDGPVVTDVITDEDDPDNARDEADSDETDADEAGVDEAGAVVTGGVADETDPGDQTDSGSIVDHGERDERWNRAPTATEGGGCGLEATPDSAPSIDESTIVRDEITLGDRVVSSIEFEIDVTKQCVAIDHSDVDDRAWTFDVTSTPALIKIDDGVAEIIRQPELVAVDAAPARPCPCTPVDISNLVDVTIPDLELTANALVADGRTPLETLLEPISPVEVTPTSIVDLRGDLDWDPIHALVPGVLGLLMLALLVASGFNPVVARPDWHRRVTGLGRWAGWAFLAALATFVVLPWLVKSVPDRVSEGLVTGPTDEQTGAFSWFPSGVQPIVAWPILAVATVVRFFQQQRSAAPASATPGRKKRNATAFLSKAISFLTRLAIGVVLVSLVLATSIMMMTSAALNGPFGNNAWISREVFSLPIPGPADLAVWAGVIIVALAVRTAFAAGTWSLGPYYRRQLRWAFMGDAMGYDAFDGSPLTESASGVEGPDVVDEVDGTRAGYLDGTSAELVICCAANVLGPDRAAAGRRAVSFSASRSWIGGPELGWVSTPEYINKMSAARRTDITVSAMTAISGAAASPAMGKQSLGPLGSVLALLNVRLGGWLPHPKAVLNMRAVESSPPDAEIPDTGPTTWKHTPGWPYFVREVVRRHKQEAAYVYVSDGGHWENLGLVESIRRGCNTIIVVSAAGDGASSHATLAEAVEIARTDLDVEIEFDDVWTMRPTSGGEPDPRLPSGRQFLRQRGDDPEIGRAAPIGWSFGTFTRRNVAYPHANGRILLIEATMVDELALDVHAYAESHAEFPDINTGDQFFANRDFESYRMLGVLLAQRALDDAPKGTTMAAQIHAMPSPAQ